MRRKLRGVEGAKHVPAAGTGEAGGDPQTSRLGEAGLGTEFTSFCRNGLRSFPGKGVQGAAGAGQAGGAPSLTVHPQVLLGHPPKQDFPALILVVENKFGNWLQQQPREN